MLIRILLFQLQFNFVHMPYSKLVSVPEKVEDEVLAQQQFKSEFLSRYAEGPDFFLDTFVAAVQKAFGCEARKRKLLGKFSSNVVNG